MTRKPYRLVALILLTATPCAAQELRMGAGYTAQTLFGVGHSPEQGASLNADYLFKPPRVLKFMGSPRPFVGLSASLSGYTDFATAGLMWRFTRGPLYADLGAGLAVHDGELTLPPPMADLPGDVNEQRRQAREDRRELGYRELYHATAGLGWRLDARWAVEVVGQHWSNGHLGSQTNDGVDIISLQMAYRY